jgi:hypothetical protein
MAFLGKTSEPNMGTPLKMGLVMPDDALDLVQGVRVNFELWYFGIAIIFDNLRSPTPRDMTPRR